MSSYAEYVISGEPPVASLHGAEAGSGGELLRGLVSDVNVRAERTAHETLTIHAGAVRGQGNTAIVLPAPAASGKSTLVAALLARGFGYLSDEYAAIDVSTRRVRPYPKPILLKPGSHTVQAHLRPAGSPWHDTSGTWVVPASRVREGCVVRAPVPLGLLVFPRYEPGAAARLEPVSRAEAMTLAGSQTSRLRSFGERVLDTLVAIVGDEQPMRLTFGDAVSAAGLLAEAVGQPS